MADWPAWKLKVLDFLKEAKRGASRRPTANEYKRLSRRLASIHKSKGGLTWHLVRGDVCEDAVVKVSKFVGIVSVFPSRGQTFPGLPTAKDFEMFIFKNKPVLGVPYKWLCVGSWYDEKTKNHHIDVSRVCFSYDKAAILARKHAQKTIYLIQRGMAIPIH